MTEQQYQEYSLHEVVSSVYHASEMCPSGMLIVGYNPREYCHRCDIVWGSFTVHFDLPITWNGSLTHYIDLCESCLSLVIACEREFQERTVWEHSPHTVA